MAVNIYAVGDSHSLFSFCRSPDIKVRWLGPMTMHRFGRDGIKQTLAERDVAGGSTVVFCAGEIDVRRHLQKIAEKVNKPIEAVIEQTTSAYVDAVKKFRNDMQLERAVICAVIPIARSSPDNPEYPRYGTRRSRMLVREIANRCLQNRAAQAQIDFLHFPKIYTDFHGTLTRHLSDGQVHIAPPCANHMVMALGKLLNKKLRFDFEPQPVRAINNIIRRLPLRNRYDVLQHIGGFPFYSNNR